MSSLTVEFLLPRRSPQTSFAGVKYVDLATTALVLLISLLVFTTPVRHRGDLLPFAQDDFYYYLTAARNIAHGAGSTFDGTTPTNGYHPLYELLLVLACRLLPTLRGIYGFLAVLDVLSAATIFVAIRAIFRRTLPNSWVSNGFTLAVLYLCFFKLYHQMEVTLALPFGFLFLMLVEKVRPATSSRRWGLIGLVAALMVLSRLDTVILVALAGAAALFVQEYRRALTFSQIGAFLGGFLPLLFAYFALNHHFFHLWMPISGAAKQMQLSHSFVWTNIVDSFSPESCILFAAALTGLLALPWLGRHLSSSQRVICIAALLFPFAHWGLLFYISDWKLWGWYAYSLRFSTAGILLLCASFLHAHSFPPALTRRLDAIYCAGYLVALTLLASAHYKVDPEMANIALAANAIQTFARQHPGRYAMGDRAGMVGYSDGRPTVQTEGLMMDDAFLNHIRKQEPLPLILKEYGIDYYIGFDRHGSRCFEAREPANAGPSSPVMHGEFCQQPVAVIPAGTARTLIFALTFPASAASPRPGAIP